MKTFFEWRCIQFFRGRTAPFGGLLLRPRLLQSGGGLQVSVARNNQWVRSCQDGRRPVGAFFLTSAFFLPAERIALRHPEGARIASNHSHCLARPPPRRAHVRRLRPNCPDRRLLRLCPNPSVPC